MNSHSDSLIEQRCKELGCADLKAFMFDMRHYESLLNGEYVMLTLDYAGTVPKCFLVNPESKLSDAITDAEDLLVEIATKLI